MNSVPESVLEVLFSEFKREIGLAATLGYRPQRQRALLEMQKRLNILGQLVRNEVEQLD